jgi:PAS domain S-box-containing protein
MRAIGRASGAYAATRCCRQAHWFPPHIEGHHGRGAFFCSKSARAKLFDSTIVGNAWEIIDFITNVFEPSTGYSVIGKDLEGKIVLWNEGARRLYGYEPEEVVGNANSVILHTPEDVAAGKPAEIVGVALRTGKWEGIITRLRKNGQRCTARVAITPRRAAP